ncbi:MAG: hydrogenase [Deltaproteobacteria bacterium RBG_13_43_22]|nr:MAG: hydrogenase [Deltaproteobacteria bacterium RBG_13_43_22]
MAEPFYRANVLVCGGTGCTASDSEEVISGLVKEIARRGLEKEVRVVPTGCRGFCAMGPIMVIYPEGIFYCQVQPRDVQTIVEETLVKGRVVGRLTYKTPETYKELPRYQDIPFYSKQVRITLRNCGIIDPEKIDEYIVQGGYEALSKALFDMTQEEVIQEVKRSGLRGRGGAGFSTGTKWEFTFRAPGEVKYVVCNADEGDPGAFMDRSLLEGDPHSLIEGMTICGYAIGASEGYIYCRAEYPLAIKRLNVAIAQAEEYGLLGDNILNTDFSFHLHIKEGAGAFVCGEETALLASIEGRRGEPRPRPPFPAASGLWGKPTNLNNVKSYANVPQIIVNGSNWFNNIGTRRSPGTAIFALTGKVNNTGLVEVPMGITLGEIIFDIGGGILKDKRFKAVQTGGPLGGCIPPQHLNVEVDFDSLQEVGAVMGSGGMIVVDEDTCMVEFSKFFLKFAQAESCGKCIPCRVGGKRMLEILTRISEGNGRLEDLDTIKTIAKGMETGSLCALGQLTPGPVMSALKYFEAEFLTHILDGECPAGSCQSLVRARCTNACPAQVDVPSFISLIAQGHFAEGLEVHREKNPFALICGRVCPAFCEQKCRRGDIDEPVAIRHAKRLMADHEIEKPWTPAKIEGPKKEKVAVIGAGPAGLTAALRLAQRGYPVTVFDKLPVAGGMMAVGIPEYRLPRNILNMEIEAIKRAGVEIKLGQEMGKDFTMDGLLDRDGYKAAILAIGAHKGRRLGIPGEDLPGVYQGVEFLKNVALGKPPEVRGKSVAVVGGGAVAIDAARTALRLGAKRVHILYRRTRQDMPAWKEEIEEAFREGIQFHFLTNPVGILGPDQVTGVECHLQRLGEFDAGGRRRPIPIEATEFEVPEFILDADLFIAAIGQASDLEGLQNDNKIEVKPDTTLAVGANLMTTREGVFAAGDVTLGPATVIEAVDQGNKVAITVDAYLKGQPLERVRFVPSDREIPQLYSMEEYAEAKRPVVRRLSKEKSVQCFEEVEAGFDEHTAREECKRCLRCDLEWLKSMGLQAPTQERKVQSA